MYTRFSSKSLSLVPCLCECIPAQTVVVCRGSDPPVHIIRRAHLRVGHGEPDSESKIENKEEDGKSCWVKTLLCDSTLCFLGFCTSLIYSWLIEQVSSKLERIVARGSPLSPQVPAMKLDAAVQAGRLHVLIVFSPSRQEYEVAIPKDVLL